MKIRMLVAMSGTRNGQEWPARGEVADLPTAEAAHLVASGVAEEVVGEGDVETATAPPAETAAPTEKRRGRPKLPRDADGNVIRE
ncbi:hypothetical protein NLX86_06665 [Streptomyces sp. A3M-1-3]|uniref:hypothetical protein n=1 Tax=Streptomyces sp. A3M-1-3 TaxID=2962044 RepID=UPI0020B892A5|nr:hypothetical protein [Streptomyces sp. A3M-1-3]MCP3817829.1 hypothetical protein [Streptomyces sp. A3M-1-3]